MAFAQETAEIFVPSGALGEDALEETTLMGIGAHQDDIEILAYHGVLQAFHVPDEHFAAVICTDGRGSSRAGVYAHYSDEEMISVRRDEQKKAAVLGEYATCSFLDFPSRVIKDPSLSTPVRDLTRLLDKARPHTIYTHNPLDKHATHIGTFLSVVAALRNLRDTYKPNAFYGCEVWRDLDWLPDSRKVKLPVDGHPNLAMSLLGAFDSQIAGGKRYDLAAIGRRRANATFLESHATDNCEALTFALDLMPLIEQPLCSVKEFVNEQIQAFAEELLSTYDVLL